MTFSCSDIFQSSKQSSNLNLKGLGRRVSIKKTCELWPRSLPRALQNVACWTGCPGLHKFAKLETRRAVRQPMVRRRLRQGLFVCCNLAASASEIWKSRLCSLPSVDTTGLVAALLNFSLGITCHGSSSELVGAYNSICSQCFHGWNVDLQWGRFQSSLQRVKSIKPSDLCDSFSILIRRRGRREKREQK